MPELPADILARLLLALDLPQDDMPAEARDLLRPLLDLRPLLQRPTRQITVLGTFKTGKSSLLNALLGEDVLPARVLRATGAVTRLRYAPCPACTLVRQQPDGTHRSEPLAFDERARHILLSLENEHSAPDLHEIVIQHPAVPLPPAWSLVDTPGLGDTAELTARSQQELLQTDLLVLVLSAYQLFSQHERDVLRHASRLLNGNIVCVVNQIDLIAPAEQADVFRRAALLLDKTGNPLVGQPRLFISSATPSQSGIAALRGWLGALAHSTTGERVALLSRLGILQSRLQQTRPALQRLLADEQQRHHQHQQRAVSAHRQQQTRLRRAALEDRLRLERLRSRLDTFGQQFAELCVQEMAQRMSQAAPDEWAAIWYDLWRASFATGLHWYTRWIQRGAVAALTATDLHAPPFEGALGLLPGAMQAADERLIAPGWLEGLAADFGTPLAALLGGSPGTLLDEWAGQMRSAAQQQFVQAVEHTANQLRPALKTAASHYLDQVQTMVTTTVEAPDPPTSPCGHTVAHLETLKKRLGHLEHSIHQARLSLLTHKSPSPMNTQALERSTIQTD